MTSKELKDYPYVLKAIERYENELAELYDDSAGSMSPDMSGMPHGNGNADSNPYNYTLTSVVVRGVDLYFSNYAYSLPHSRHLLDESFV